MADVILEYPYKAKPWMMLAGAAFFGACAALMAHAALTNDRGLILNGIITFSVQGATIFYWCVAGVSALFVLAAAVALAAGLANPMVIRLTSTDLSAPRHGFARRLTQIRLAEISDIRVLEVQKQRFITVCHRGGKLNVAQSMLPSAAAFEKLHAALLANVRVKSC